MRNVLIITNLKLDNIIFPEDNDKYILSYRFINEEQAKKEIEFNTCRTFVGKKEIINLYKIDKKVQIVEAKKHSLKTFDKILFQYENGKYVIIELLEVKKHYKLLKRLKWI